MGRQQLFVAGIVTCTGYIHSSLENLSLTFLTINAAPVISVHWLRSQLPLNYLYYMSPQLILKFNVLTCDLRRP